MIKDMICMYSSDSSRVLHLPAYVYSCSIRYLSSAAMSKFAKLAALQKAETPLFTVDAKMETETQETASEGRTLQAHKSDPEAPVRKHPKSESKNEEAVAAARHKELLDICGGMRLAMDKFVKDQSDLSTKMTSYKDNSNQISK